MGASDGVIWRNCSAEYSDYRITVLKEFDGDPLLEILIIGAFNQSEGCFVQSSYITAELIGGMAKSIFKRTLKTNLKIKPR